MGSILRPVENRKCGQILKVQAQMFASHYVPQRKQCTSDSGGKDGEIPSIPC